MPRPGASSEQLLQVSRGVEASQGYCLEPLDCEVFVLYRNRASISGVPCEQCPIRVGKVVRLNYELDVPSVVVESYWPLLKPSKFDSRVNVFGSWLRSGKPISDGAPASCKKPAGSAWSATPCTIVNVVDVLVWPLDMEDGTSAYPGSVRIPFSAFEYLWQAHALNLALPEFTFARRGQAYYERVVRQRQAEGKPKP